MKETPQLIDDICARHGINRSQLAQLVRCTPGTITRWAQGDREPRYKDMDQLRALLKAGKKRVKEQLKEKA